MDIKLHPDAKKLLDEINARRRGHIVERVQSKSGTLGLSKGKSNLWGSGGVKRVDLEGRGGPL